MNLLRIDTFSKQTECKKCHATETHRFSVSKHRLQVSVWSSRPCCPSCDPWGQIVFPLLPFSWQSQRVACECCLEHDSSRLCCAYRTASCRLKIVGQLQLGWGWSDLLESYEPILAFAHWDDSIVAVFSVCWRSNHPLETFLQKDWIVLVGKPQGTLSFAQGCVVMPTEIWLAVFPDRIAFAHALTLRMRVLCSMCCRSHNTLSTSFRLFRRWLLLSCTTIIIVIFFHVYFYTHKDKIAKKRLPSKSPYHFHCWFGHSFLHLAGLFSLPSPPPLV